MSANLVAVKDALCQWDNFGYLSSVLVVLGFQMLWYGPRMMGKVWSEAKGVQRKIDRDRQIASGVMYLVMSLVVSYLADATGCSTAKDALWLGALLWLGFALPLAVVQNANDQSGGNKVVLLVDLTGQLIFFMAQAVCLVYFRHCDLQLDFWKGFMGGAAVESEA